MWLPITAGAALTTSVLWCATGSRDKYRLGFLSLMYWGATLMWLVDHVITYVEDGGPFLDLGARATWLGVSVIVLGLVVWSLRLLAGERTRVLALISGTLISKK